MNRMTGRPWLPLLALLLTLGVALPPGALALPARDGSVILQVDTPHDGDSIVNTTAIVGWAVDQSVTSSPGISSVAIYMDGDATNGRFIGNAQLGVSRPDVAAALGNPAYATAGWTFSLDGLDITGAHSFNVFAYGASGLVTGVGISPVSLIPPAPPTPAPPPTPPAPPSPPPPPNPPPAALTISIVQPAQGAPVSSPFVLQGSVSAVPPGQIVEYQVTNQSGAVLSSGQLAVQGGIGAAGTFVGYVSYPAGVSGPGVVQVTIPNVTPGPALAIDSVGVEFAGSPPPPPPPARTITIDTPANGAVVGDPFVVRGRVSVVLLGSHLEYRVYNQTGGVIASGEIAVEGVPGQAGTYEVTIFVSRFTGPAQIEVSDGEISASVSVTVI